MRGNHLDGMFQLLPRLRRAGRKLRPREANMAHRSSSLRGKVLLRSTESPFSYVTGKSRRNNPDRLRLRKFDPTVRRHVEFVESR
jgi:large subunit ribosomal protein L33